MSDDRKPTPPGSGHGSAPCDPTRQTCPIPPCTLAEITVPRGSYTSSSNPVSSWLTSPCFHFDFQGVVSGSPGPYVLTITGRVDPASTYSCQWTLAAAAGTLSGATTTSPTHTAPASAGQGNLTLTGAHGGTAAGCTATKVVKIYRDHLARDEENFGVGTDCRGPTWTFRRFGANVTMQNRWNCHGGTTHVYNGSGSGSAAPSGVAFLLDPSKLKKTVTVTHLAGGGGSHPALGPLSRGDIVAYFTAGGQLAHTQTCTGNGDETYGANNIPLSHPGRPDADEAWKWGYSPAGDWANNAALDLDSRLGAPAGTIIPFTIKVFSKP
jgi:hypothetical protein